MSQSKHLASGFRPDFVWGAATSAYQIEGGHNADGKGPSSWDVWSSLGRIDGGHSGDVACDHYNRYQEDVALMKGMNAKAYRFSINWPRVMPEGTGRVNEAGLAFYDRLVDSLLAKGIEPWVSVFHWELPYALQQRGGYLNPDIPEWFAVYSDILARRLGDRVKNWMTINEQSVPIGSLLSRDGVRAPGQPLSYAEFLRAAHLSNLSHGRIVQALRSVGGSTFRIGTAIGAGSAIPASETPSDIAAARSAYFSVLGKDPWQNAWFVEPIFRGQYPEDGLLLAGKDSPRFTDAELNIIRQPLDFLGFNAYSGNVYRAGPDGRPARVSRGVLPPQASLDWIVLEPDALYWASRFFHERYQLPIVVTENGMCAHDWVHLDGKVHDCHRIDYMHRYLLGLRRAAHEGVDVRGYFAWSFLDNLEWSKGFRPRFGLIHVDFDTLMRTPKDSYHWYAEVIRTNGANLA